MKTPSREWKYLLHKGVAVHAPPGEGVRVVIDRPYFKECRISVKVPVPHSPSEIEVDPCGCSFLEGKPLKVCDECLQRRLGP